MDAGQHTVHDDFDSAFEALSEDARRVYALIVNIARHENADMVMANYRQMARAMDMHTARVELAMDELHAHCIRATSPEGKRAAVPFVSPIWSTLDDDGRIDGEMVIVCDIGEANDDGDE